MEGKEVRRLRNANIRPMSLEEEYGDEGLAFGETFADDRVIDPAARAETCDTHGELHALIGDLGERERFIVRSRFGFGGDNPMTFRQIGERLGFSSERIRQLHETALGKLRGAAVRRFEDAAAA